METLAERDDWVVNTPAELEIVTPPPNEPEPSLSQGMLEEMQNQMKSFQVRTCTSNAVMQLVKRRSSLFAIMK